MQLSKNFTLEELTRTSKDSLQAINIEQATNDLSVLQNLTDVAKSYYSLYESSMVFQ